MIGIDLISIAIYGVMFIVGLLVGLLFFFMYMRAKIPGLSTWITASMKNLPVVLNSYMDGFAEFKIMKKESGSMVFNADTTEEFIDRSIIDKKPMASLHGHRIMYRVTASAIPTSPDEYGDIQRVLDHIDENIEQYPLLSKLQEYEIFGALGHEPQTVRELLSNRCQVETRYIMNDKVVERPQEEIDLDIEKGVDAYMLEVDKLKRNLKFLPRQSVFVDLARCVDATQLRIASQILKRYRAEIEALYRAKYGGIENSLWKGVVMGGAVGLIGGGVAVKLIGG